MPAARRAAPAALLFVALAALCGCNSGPKIVPVSGTLTRNGKPVPYLTVNFEPATGRPSWGVADENGRFTLEYDITNKGAVTGTHTVWVIWRPSSPQEEFNPAKAKKPAELDAIQTKYGSGKSPIKVDITAATDSLEIKLD
ncbi:MAG: hypothetical protein ACKODX_23065 [Gemmata sp.]